MNKMRGPAWLLRRLSQALAPEPPFFDEEGRKGVFTWLTMAPPHRFVTHRIAHPAVSKPWRIALVADLHAGSYAWDIERLGRIMAEVDAQEPDLVLLLGDYVNMMGFGGGRIPPHAIARCCAFPRRASAPLPCWAITIGNMATTPYAGRWKGRACSCWRMKA